MPIDGNKLLIFHYTAQGFVPATIEAQPTEDLSAINFLGEQIATRHPVVQSWGAGPPSQVNYDSAVQAQGDYRPIGNWRVNRFIRWSKVTKTPSRLAATPGSAIRWAWTGST